MKSLGLRIGLGFVFLVSGAACSVTATRPVQEMSYTAAALRAAKEVQADTLAVEQWQKAREWYFKARKEYRFKNFEEAEEYAKKARQYAEEAELKSALGGGKRTSLVSEEPPPQSEGKKDDAQHDGKDAGFEQNPKPMYLEEYEQKAANPTPLPTASGNPAPAPTSAAPTK